MIRKLINRIFSRRRAPAAVEGVGGVSHGAKPDPSAPASATPAARRAARASRGKFGGRFGGGIGKSSGPVMVPVSSHGIDAKLVSANATRVTRTLQENGFRAFVVGGAVRDLLLGVKPKDFDVATDAVPEEIQRLFRRAHIIGRRFRLVHVMFGADTIEVSTFRANNVVPVAGAEVEVEAEAKVEGQPQKRNGSAQHVSDEHGRVLRDNIFGSQEEDAARRDFTVNALFYDPETQTVIDYHHGVADIKSRTMRMIGDPEKRYREDPVRMLRAVRFAAKLGFAIDEATREPIARLAPLLENVPSARLFDEMLKLLMSGHALACLKRLRAEGLHHGMLPLLDVVLEQPMGERFVTLALESTDTRVRIGKPAAPSFLFAALLWHEVLKNWNETKARGEYPIPALGNAMDEVLDAQTGKLAIQRRYTADMREIWGLQPRLERRAGRAPWRLIEHPRFRAGYDFLLLRGAAGEIDAALGDWWTHFIDADSAGREALQNALSASDAAGAGVKRKRRRKKKSTTEGAAEVDPAAADAPQDDDAHESSGVDGDGEVRGDAGDGANDDAHAAPATPRAAAPRARKPVADKREPDADPAMHGDNGATGDTASAHDGDAADAAAPRKPRRRRPRKAPVE